MSALPAAPLDFAPAARRACGPVIAVASGKGGVGKTVVSATLAHAFSKRGERTLLVDADLGMANVDVQLGLNPRGDLASIVGGRITLPEAISPVMGGAEKRGGFDVISGRSGSAALASLDLNSVGRIAAGLTAASMCYGRTILDLAAGADRANVRLASTADDIVIVINDEPTALTDAYAFVKTLRMRDEGAAPFVAVNNCPDLSSAEAAYLTFSKTCESFLGFTPPLAGIIRRDPHVGRAIRAQLPLPVHCPSCDAAKDLARLAKTLAGGVEV